MGESRRASTVTTSIKASSPSTVDYSRSFRGRPRFRLQLPSSTQNSLSRLEDAPSAFLERRPRIARCSFAPAFASRCLSRSPRFASNTRRLMSCLLSSSLSLTRFLICRRQRLSSSPINSASTTAVHTLLAMVALRVRVKKFKNLAHIRLSRHHAVAWRRESLKKPEPYDSSHMKASWGCSPEPRFGILSQLGTLRKK